MVVEVFLGITPCGLVNIDILEEFAFIFRVVVETGLRREATDLFETPVSYQLTRLHTRRRALKEVAVAVNKWCQLFPAKFGTNFKRFVGDLIFQSCC